MTKHKCNMDDIEFGNLHITCCGTGCYAEGNCPVCDKKWTEDFVKAGYYDEDDNYITTKQAEHRLNKDE